MKQEIRCIIEGRVQMVMFRDFARRKAQALDLVGTVRNVSDGSVEVIAQGSREKLEEFIKHLKKGPILSKVTRIDVRWKESQDELSNFNIVY